MSKCACVYATSANTPSVRSGHEMGGYLKEECETCKAAKSLAADLFSAEVASENATKEIFKKEYDGESICDLSRDVSEAFDERFNPAVADIPEIEHGFHAGTFTVTITWKADS